MPVSTLCFSVPLEVFLSTVAKEGPGDMAPRTQIAKSKPIKENTSKLLKLFYYYFRYDRGLPLTIEGAGGIVDFHNFSALQKT